ncbi:MAG: hypothetical protein IIZ14_07325 [Solobacterium sp.]|nr:hypothetical protein [Solobacterium sp.]
MSETMTKRERFEHFLRNEPVDRAPVALFHHFTTYSQWLEGLNDPEAFEQNIEGHRIARKIFDPDVIKVMNDTLMFMVLDETFVKHAEDLAKIEIPGPGSLFFEKSLELTNRVLAFYEDSDAPRYFTGFSPYTILRWGLNSADIPTEEGKTKIQMLIEEDKDAVMEALDRIADSVIALNHELFTKTGVEGLYYSVNNQGHHIPDDMYREVVTPSDIKVMEDANKYSRINMLHICGYDGMPNNLELYKDYDIPIVNWAVHAEGVSLSEGKKLFGGRPVCGGFAQATTIYKGTLDEVEKETFAYLKDAGTLGVMIGADCTVPPDIDDERLNWVRRACARFAQMAGK